LLGQGIKLYGVGTTTLVIEVTDRDPRRRAT